MRARTAGPSGASPSSSAIRWLPCATSRSWVETKAATRASGPSAAAIAASSSSSQRGMSRSHSAAIRSSRDAK